jgi:signal transduction histidine kinase/DNA-binding response OmpR family regulator
MALSLQRKIVVGFVVAGLVLVGVSVETYRAFGYVTDSAAWVNHTHVTIEALNDVVSDVVDAETSQRGYLLTGLPRYLAPYDSNASEVGAHLRELQDLTVDNPPQHARADTLGRFAHERIATLAARIDLARHGHIDRAIAEIRSVSGAASMDSLRAVAARMDAEERRLLVTRAALEQERRRYSRAVTAIALLVALAIALFAVATILHDVRAREQAARDLAEAALREQAANRAKSEFLARMSHELRTPLNSVIGFANVLLKNKQGVLREQELSFVERIRANGTHLLGIINDILDLAKVESGRMDLVVEPVDVPSLVRDTVAQVSEREHVRVDVALPADTRPLAADRDKLKQVLLNLVANAMKFTEQGRVVVRVVTNPATGAVRRIDVVDTGVGIPPERVSAIFDAFEQAESTTARRYGGTGLGLAIARSFCERMGFRLVVASEQGVGSTFSILCDPAEPLPRHAPPDDAAIETPGTMPVEASPIATTPDVDDANKPTVLVIDDSADSRLLLSQFLEDDGKHVVTAVSGEQGLQLARELKPGLIVLDLLMPGVDGWQTLRRLKDDSATATIPVVIVSIVASEQRGNMLGAVDLVDKPVNRESLVATVRRNLAEATARVLVVEDSPDTRALFQGYLRELPGLDVRMVDTGRGALAQLESFQPQLVILDLTLPDIDGLEVLRELRKHRALCAIPVIVATARNLSAAERTELAAQTHAVLAKGADIAEQLRESVRAALPSVVGAGGRD